LFVVLYFMCRLLQIYFYLFYFFFFFKQKTAYDVTRRDWSSDVCSSDLLDGVRGLPPADTEALVEIVLRVQRMALELGDGLAELDINPLVVLPRGQGAVALDALAVCR